MQLLPPELVGSSPSVALLRLRLSRAALAHELPVHFAGRASAGKRFAAVLLHRKSRRVDAPCLVLASAGLKSQELEARLHEARGGSVVLQDVHALPERSQEALLRHLLRREAPTAFPKAPDTRIVTCSTQSLASSCRRGGFREELARRLLVLCIAVPSLAERRSDVGVLARHVLAALHPGTDPVLSPAALRKLEEHPWPGNVSEFVEVLERAALLCGDPPRLEAEHLTLGGRQAAPESQGLLPTRGMNLGEVLGNIEKALVREALERAAWNRQQAARLLGMQRTTLVQKLRRWETES